MSNGGNETNDQSRFVFVGHARLPQSLALREAPALLVELEVEGEDSLVAAVEVSSPLPAANRLLARLLLGRSLRTDYEEALVEFQRQYLGPPQKAICTALNSAYELYQRHLRRSHVEPFFPDRLASEHRPRLGLNRNGPF